MEVNVLEHLGKKKEVLVRLKGKNLYDFADFFASRSISVETRD